MSNKYKSSSEVPTEALVDRLHELSEAIRKGKAFDGELTMRIPAEVDRDADLVLSESANRLSVMRGWISVESELPPNLELVDCWIGSEGRRIPDCKMVDGKWHYFSEYGEYEYNPDFYPLLEIPTHWRKLPEPPK